MARVRASGTVQSSVLFDRTIGIDVDKDYLRSVDPETGEMNTRY